MGSVVQCGNVVGGKQLYMFKTGVCRLVTVLNPGDGVVWGQIQKKIGRARQICCSTKCQEDKSNESTAGWQDSCWYMLGNGIETYTI
jgi:hypothetical protein